MYLFTNRNFRSHSNTSTIQCTCSHLLFLQSHSVLTLTLMKVKKNHLQEGKITFAWVSYLPFYKASLRYSTVPHIPFKNKNNNDIAIKPN